ncbi:rRNA maturation RNase YbeY [Mangrovitalea sediminis]|uniref:rRNA maturation RNase YbeY n=1 Tax=Mangrovitalea sediminis TaxID=1982043 RepID=UPI000BE5AC6D|nr:rRNA maturation RNase YbeY [Mangrovitalea sediminis]
MTDVNVDLQIATSDANIPEASQIKRWAEQAYQGEEPTEVTIRVVDPEESQDLNTRYRGKEKPTNVLSFPFEAPPGITLPLLGDLAVCASVVTREAAEQGKPLDMHWAHMVIHGVLHLQGYDHETEAEADVMEALEIRLLAELGYPNPYQD